MKHGFTGTLNQDEIIVVRNNRIVERQWKLTYSNGYTCYGGWHQITVNEHITVYGGTDAQNRFDLLDASAQILYDEPTLLCLT